MKLHEALSSALEGRDVAPEILASAFDEIVGGEASDA